MKYILAILLNIFFAVCYEYSIPSLVVFPFTAALLIAIYYYATKENSKVGAFLELLCFTLPFAWRSIFGTSFSSFSISWFYLVGFSFLIFLMLSRKVTKVRLSKDNALSIQLIILLMGLGIIPLIKSFNFANGLTEYIMYAFFYTILFATILHEGSLTQNNKFLVLKSFTYMALYSAIAISIQFVLSRFGINILKNEMFGSNNVRYAYAYMFEDMSSASIFLVAGAMVCLVYGKRIFRFPYLIMITILIGTALSSTRTGIVAFGFVAVLYIMISRSSKHKILKIIFLSGAAYLVFNLYSIIRPMDSLSTIVTYDNGRFDLITNSIMLFMRYPIFGTGFDSTAFIELTSSPVVGHTYILTVLTMTGIVYTFVFTLFLTLGLSIAKKKQNNEEIWILILAFVGSCFIPNLMGARFLVILYAIIFLSSDNRRVQSI
ncbi:hypothetical protein JI667_16745 [Bacillus sp. NTK074B]|uniref:O-antigen ligase family protein n=1 Tax=Bacillus sp. NTK074B TaxID=2802174 RepID=UPI001A8E004B|nr:hypothetical protein [Bacillus sp. NTK074B]